MLSSLGKPISASTISSSFLLLTLSFFSRCFLHCLGEAKVSIEMDESKKAAKAFVDQYFPIYKEPNPKSNIDALGDLFFPPIPKKEFPTERGHKALSLHGDSTISDGKSQAIDDTSQSTTQKGSNGVEHCEVSEPCLMSSAVDYGCRDDYPYNPDNRYPGPPSYVEKNDGRDGSEHQKPENPGAEWWQGSLYY